MADFSVKDRASGKGVTDDAGAFTAAISAAVAGGGGTVSVPRDTYKLNSTVSVPTGVLVVVDAGVTLTGTGGLATTGQGMVLDFRGGGLTIGTDAHGTGANSWYSSGSILQTFAGTEDPNAIVGLVVVSRHTASSGGSSEALDLTSSSATGSTANFTNMQAVGFTAGHLGSGTVTWARGAGGFIFNTVGGGTITNAAVFYAYDAVKLSGGSIGTLYGGFIEQPTKGTNNVGFYVAGGATQALWVGSGNTLLGGTLQVVGATQLSTLGAFAAGDKYVIVDSSGNLHKSATGPAS